LSRPRSSNTSRAYWELRAEQVMDRVFQGNRPSSEPRPEAGLDPIEVRVHEASQPLKALSPRPWQLALGGILLAGLGSSAGLWGAWQSAQRDLRQERNLRLLEGIRSLGDSPGKESADPSTPPAPPDEAWIEQLPPLSVPLHGTLPAQTSAPLAAPLAGPGQPEGSDMPVLLGVVQIPGKPGSAIFQIGSSSTNALVGESIGSSGWRLISAQADAAVIERAGQRRRVNISSGL